MDSVARVGQPAPDFSLNDLSGTEYTLTSARGRVLVLNFWSLDCPHSERADGLIADLRNEWEGQVAVWSIASNVNEAPEQILRVAEQRAVSLILHDPGSQIADLYNAQTTPHLFVIDLTGILRYTGALDDATFRKRSPTRNYLTEAVEAVQRGSVPETAETAAYGCSIVRHILGVER